METNESSSSWNEAYALGIPTIDSRFERIFDLYDQLLQIKKKKNPFADDELQNVLQKLESYLEKHANISQELIKSTDFQEIDLYVSNYQKLITRVDQFIITYSSNNPVLLNELLDYLKKWLFTQILQARKIYL